MRFFRSFPASLALASTCAVVAACGSAETDEPGTTDSNIDVTNVTLPTSAAVTVTEPRTMMFLEENGYSFKHVLRLVSAGAPAPAPFTGRKYTDSAAYREIVRVVENEIKGKPEAINGVTVTDERYKEVPFDGARLPFDRTGIGGTTPASDATVAARLPNYGPSVGVGVKYAHRLFDPTWLTSDKVHIELIAVSNGFDGRLFGGNSCGDVRLIYRLGIKPDGRPFTLLPFTFQVRFSQPMLAGGNCQENARRWLSVPGSGESHGPAFLLNRVLRPLGFVRTQDFYGVDINYQVMHQSSELNDPDDHAEYVIRVFDGTSAGLRVGKLPMVPRQGMNRADVVRWVKANIPKIDLGISSFNPGAPRADLALFAVSHSTRGMARRANRPFGEYLDESDFKDIEGQLLGTKTIRSPAMLIRRLDSLTCQGCHQMRSIAGFHIVGEPRPNDPARPELHRAQSGNAVHMGVSPHLELEETPYRLGYIKAIAAGADGRTYDEPLPWHGRSGVDMDADGKFTGRGDAPAPIGSHCSLDNATFGGWNCAPGLECVDVSGDERKYSLGADGSRTLDPKPRLGTCRAAGGGRIGDPAQLSTVTPRWTNASQLIPSLDGDGVARTAANYPTPCAPGSFVLPNRNGFPGGMCSTGCRQAGAGAVSNIGGRDVVCTRVPELRFEEYCFFKFGAASTTLAKAELQTQAIETCLTSETGGKIQSDLFQLQKCDVANQCRDDYVCARVPGPNGTTVGGCVPPYFIFQLRVDGPPSDRNLVSAAPPGGGTAPATCTPNEPGLRPQDMDNAQTRASCLASPVDCVEDLPNPTNGGSFICWKNGAFTASCSRRCVNGSFVPAN
ncbi:MAG: hypothetical protein IPK71_22530 [Myxococcales bacterium]|nr:hypothetical protein [Myxococcales bacterium]